jgi:trans-aconitate methyltransferase
MIAQIVEADVLTWSPPRPVDVVYEQTCMCALHPDHWARYAGQLHAWLKPGGRLYAMWMQKQRPGAAEGLIEGPPFHSDINAMRSLLPSTLWDWPKPPYASTPHHSGAFELGVVLTRR